jgi:hypothetical protein
MKQVFVVQVETGCSGILWGTTIERVLKSRLVGIDSLKIEELRDLRK